MANEIEITKVQIVIRKFLWHIQDALETPEKAFEFLQRFAKTLQFQELYDNPDSYASMILAEARSFNDKKKRNAQIKYVREELSKQGIKNPTQDQIEEKWLEMYGMEKTGDASDSDAEDGTAAGKNPGTAARDNVSKTKKARANEKQPLHSERDAGAESRIIFKAPTKEELYDYCAEHGIDQADARDCWEMCESRQWADRDGVQINDWKGFVKGFCNSRKRKRSA